MRDERGSASSFFLVACWTLILAGLIVAADLGRVFLYREQISTAVDAAALAGAQHVVRMVKVTVERRKKDLIKCAELPEGDECNEYIYETPAIPAAPYPLDYRRQWCVGGWECTSVTWDCWLEPKGGDWNQVAAVARAMFAENARGTAWEPYVRLSEPLIGSPRSGTWEFHVTHTARVEVPTLLWGSLGKQSLTASRSGKGHISVTAMPRPVQRPPGATQETAPVHCMR